ncbi:OSCP1 protein [Sarcoptes scabiei]|nr:OSCP1 protein [Sarcoptes scabiei]
MLETTINSLLETTPSSILASSSSITTLASATSTGATIVTDINDVLWIIIVTFIIAFFLAFGIGANDVANSFGTSVGSKVLTLRQACILATIFEILGAILLGYKVSGTIRTGMINVEMYDDTKLLMLGYLAALFGSAIWNLVATLFGLPVSGTHSIVGAIIGFSLVAQGIDSVKWEGLIRIVVSWFLSPVLSGLVSMSLYLFVKNHIINQPEPSKNGLRMLPVFYGFTIFINIFSIIHNRPTFIKPFTWWIALIIAFVIGTFAGILVRIWVVPNLRQKVLEMRHSFRLSSIHLPHHLPHLPHLHHHHHHHNHNHHNNHHNHNHNHDQGDQSPQILNASKLPMNEIKDGDEKQSNDSDKKSHLDKDVDKDLESGTDNAVIYSRREKLKRHDPDDDKPEVAKIFTFLHILTACFSSFAHGANDTSNAIGPLVAVMMLYQSGEQSDESPWYLLLYGGIGMSFGLWICGRKVIKIIGSKLTKITPSTGFTIEIGAAATVLFASKVGLPVSTTHCQVGSVVFVGRAMKTKQGVNWRLFINIAISWALTVPLSALFSAIVMWTLMSWN